MNRLKITSAIACEYVVESGNGKNTLINAFPGDLLVKEFPASIPLSFYIELSSRTSFDASLEILSFINKKKTGGLKTQLLMDGRPALMILPTNTILFEKESELRITMKVNNDKSMLVIKKRILLNSFPVLSTSSPPQP